MKLYIYNCPKFLERTLTTKYKQYGIEVTSDDRMSLTIEKDYDVLLTFDVDSTYNLDMRTLVYDWTGYAYSDNSAYAKEIIDDFGYEIFGPYIPGASKYIDTLYFPYRYWDIPRVYQPMIKPAGVAWFEQIHEWRKYFDVWEECDNVFLKQPLRTKAMNMLVDNGTMFYHIPTTNTIRKVLAYQTKIGVLSTMGYIGRWFNYIFEGRGLPFLDADLILDYPASRKNVELQAIKEMSYDEFVTLWHESHEWAKENMGFNHWLEILE